MADTASQGFVFSAEQEELRQVVRKLCADVSRESDVRAAMETSLGHEPQVWSRLGSELGVLGLAVPTAYGGAGDGLVAQAVVAEELGAALLCGPILGTVGLAIPALVVLPDESVAAELLPPHVDGDRIAALAMPCAADGFDPVAVPVSARRAGTGWVLDGTVDQVVDGAAAELLLVPARTDEGAALFAVDGAAGSSGGLSREPLSTMDLTRRQASIRLDECPARLLAGPADAERVCVHALDVGAVLLAAEQVGGAAHLLDLTVEYANNRMQFGRAIGSFQAVKHRCADMLVAVEHARSTAYHAAWALQDGTDDPRLAASIAQATCSEAYYRVAADTIQIHGGIGFTWEHQAHLYYKRAVTDAALLGSAAQHRERVAELLLDGELAS